MSAAYPYPKDEFVSARMRRNRKTGTTPEVTLRALLHRRGHRFRKNFPIRMPERTVRPDIVFTRQRVAVFVDGCFWHRCPEHGTSPRFNSEYWQAKLDGNVQRDSLVDAALRANGWTPVRVWEHESPETAANAVETALRS